MKTQMVASLTLRTATALALIATGTSAARGQTEITPGPSGVTASADDGNGPAHTVDGSLDTRWSASGDGQWIQFDLGTTRSVGSARIAFYKGDTRSASFEIQVSTGGGAWDTVFTGTSSGASTAGERFEFPDAQARWVRYLGHGNSSNAWNSLTEVNLYAGSGEADVELTPPGAQVTASSQDRDNGPANAVDGSLATRWSANGDGEWLQLDLGATKTVSFVKVAVYNGASRRNRFEVQVSSGGGVWDTVWSGESGGTTIELETYDFPDVPARWVRYLGHGSSVNSWNSVTEIEVWGRGASGCVPPSGTSALWNDFVQARRNGTEPILPDFSYAGYRRSDEPVPDVAGPVFQVGDHGALPNDSAYDDAGIQAAIDAAEAAGGGVVLFAAGRYRVNPTEDSSHLIRIDRSGVVLRGAGSGSGGTEILMVAKKQGGKMFRIEPPSWNATIVATVTANATRETFWLTVDSTSQLRVGQYVVLRFQSPEYNGFYFAGLPLDPDWERVVTGGVGVHEMHEVAEVAGNRVRFKEPLHFTVRLGGSPWRLEAVQPLERIGIEDLRFSGSWDTYPEDFVHHKDWIHDSGWSLVSVKQTVHGWVRNVEFRHFNDALATDSLAWFTVENVRFTGKKGHSSIGCRRGYGLLVKDGADTARTHHGPATGYNVVGTVYLRHRMQSDQSVDNHGGVPHACLLDQVQGGVLSGNGGPLVNYPHTGRYYTLWNFAHQSGSTKSYDFWNAVSRNSHTFALPIFTGFTSDRSVTFQSQGTEVQVNESFGTPVTPASLFEAQLQLRKCP